MKIKKEPETRETEKIEKTIETEKIKEIDKYIKQLQKG